MAEHLDDIESDAIVGRYRIVRRIGRGGMGAVYEAVHLDLEKRVALKVLLAAMAARPEQVARFEREGRAAAKVRHPNVVDVVDVGTHHGTPYLVMELLEGEDLGKLLRREGALSVERTVEIMAPVLSAVAAAHARGVIHRDLKPENIFLARVGDGSVVPKVLDFGISKVVESDDALTHSGMMMGTAHYMSPEQAQSTRRVDAKSDQFTLGVILYQCVTGRVPFRGETMFMILSAMVRGDYPRPTELRPDLPPAFEAMLARAMHTDLDERFRSVAALGDALRAFAPARPGVSVAAVTPTLAERAPSIATVPGLPVHRRAARPVTEPPRDRARVGVAALVALLLTGSLALLLRGGLPVTTRPRATATRSPDAPREVVPTAVPTDVSTAPAASPPVASPPVASPPVRTDATQPPPHPALRRRAPASRARPPADGPFMPIVR